MPRAKSHDRSGPRRARVQRLSGVVVVAAVLAGMAVVGLQAGALRGFQRRALDNFHPASAADPRVMVIGIDSSASEDAGPAWPWPRDVHADLIQALDAAGAEVIVYDVVFDAPSVHDQVLADAIRSHGKVVLAEAVDLGLPGAAGVPTVTRRVGPTSQVAAAGTAAHAAVTPDGDGVARTLPAVVETADGAFLPGLSVAAVGLLQHGSAIPTVRPNGVQIGPQLVKTEPGQRLPIAYTRELRSGGSRVISALEVLDGDVGDLAGAVVLVGVTDLLSSDTHDVPRFGTQPGVFVHANAVSTLLSGTPRTPPQSRDTVVMVFLLALSIGVASRTLAVWLVPVAGIAILGLFVAAASTAFDAGVELEVVYPTIAGIVAAVAAVALRYREAAGDRRRLALLFAEYVPPAVARDLVERGVVQEALDGQRLDLTVLFCDLRGFTPLAASLQPAQIRDVLNIYYEEVGGLILQHEGTLMQYVGDEVYAVFGAPLVQPDHVAKAVACATAVRDVAPAINTRLQAGGLPPISYGIGINTGTGVAAHCGGALRRQYTVVGNVVNVGSRVCGRAAAGQAVVTDAVARALGGSVALEALGAVELKGVAEPVPLYLLGARRSVAVDPLREQP